MAPTMANPSIAPSPRTSPIRPRRHCGAWIGGVDASSPTRVPGHARRTYPGRPRSSIRFRTSVAMATSVAWRPSVRERSTPPITRLKREMSASTSQGAPVVPGRLLPAHAAARGDGLEVPVPPRRRGLGRRARHRAGTRWHNHLSLRMPRRDLGVDVVPVERAVGGERGDRAVDPVEQGTGPGTVVGVVAGQRRRDDPPGVGVRGQMELSPPAPRPGAVPLHQPLAGAAELEPRAVHQQVYGFFARPRRRPRHLQRLGPAAEGGVVRHREVEPEQLQDGGDRAASYAAQFVTRCRCLGIR
jgi:hypothetical protein